MGADLIGWHAKGPASLTLTDERREQIIDQLEQIAHWWRGLPEDVHDDETDEKLLAAISGCPLPTDLDMLVGDTAGFRLVMGWLERDEHGQPVANLREHLTALTKKLPADWPPTFRDSSYVQDPDDHEQLLVFAGELSWGNEPEGGGFTTLKMLALTGIGAAVGIQCLRGYFTITCGG